MYFSEFGSYSYSVLQSTEPAIISQRVSTADNLPLKIGDDAVKASNSGDIIAI